MAKAQKSKQTKTKSTPSLTIRSKTKASGIIPEKVTTNPHRRNTKLWKKWEATNNLIPSSESIIIGTTTINNSTRTVQDLQILNTWLWILGNYIINKWENLDNFLDNKIKKFIIIFINYFKFFIKILFNI